MSAISKILNSIRFRVWVLFIGFTSAILMFLYVEQVVLLPTFYSFFKTQESMATILKIKNLWDSPNLFNEMYVIANEQEMYIKIDVVDLQTAISYEQDPNNYAVFSFSDRIFTTNEETRERIKNSKSGYVTETTTLNDRTILILRSMMKDNGVIRGYITIINYIEPLTNTQSVLKSMFFMNASIVLIIAFFLSAFVVTSISNPIIKITLSAKKLTTGEFNMKAKNHDYTEIKLLTSNLNKASKEIAKTENLRKDLLANVSHDLKTPLTMIKAYAEMIRDLSGDNPEKREKHLRVIIDEADRLNGLVVDMLDLSKLQSGVVVLKTDVFNFSEHLISLMNRFNYLSESGYGINSEIEADMMIKADISKLEQVVYNLVNNAINYSGEDKKVEVKLYLKKSNCGRFEVRDNGYGIAKEELPYIWERYYKAEKSEFHKRTEVGTGLGLSIVKGVLEKHGFSYGVDSVLGKGSMFWFEFPVN